MDTNEKNSVLLLRRMQKIKTAAKDVIQDKDYMRTKLLLEAKYIRDDLISVLNEALDMPMIKDNLLGFAQTNGYTFQSENPVEEYRILTNEHIRGEHGITWFISVNMTKQKVLDIFFDTGVALEDRGERYISVITGLIYEMVSAADDVDESKQEAWLGELAMERVEPVADAESAKWAIDAADVLDQIASDFQEVADLLYENLYEQLRMLEQLVALKEKGKLPDKKDAEPNMTDTGVGVSMLDHSAELAGMTGQAEQKG